MSLYGRLPNEMSESDSLMLAANMDHVLSMHGIAIAKGISMAMGSPQSTADAVFAMTGSSVAAANTRNRLLSESRERRGGHE